MKSVHCTLRIGMGLAGSVGVSCSMGSGSLEGASAAGRRDRWLSVIQVLKIDVNVHQMGHAWEDLVTVIKSMISDDETSENGMKFGSLEGRKRAVLMDMD